jgi:hypothetical protein
VIKFVCLHLRIDQSLAWINGVKRIVYIIHQIVLKTFATARKSFLMFVPSMHCKLFCSFLSSTCDAIGEIEGKEGADVYCLYECIKYPTNCPAKRCRCYWRVFTDGASGNCKKKMWKLFEKKKIKMQISLFLKWITYLNVYIFLPIKFNYSPFEIILSFLRQLCLVCRKQWRHFFFIKKCNIFFCNKKSLWW